MLDHEVCIENMEKSPEFNRLVEDAQRSDSKYNPEQNRYEGPLCDLPLSTNFDEMNRKQRFASEKGNKSVDYSMKDFAGKPGMNTSSHYQSNSTTESSFYSSNPYKKTPETKRAQKYSSLPTSVRTASDSSLANNLRKEVDALRENLKMKDKQLKESLLTIEYLQKDLKKESTLNLAAEDHTNRVSEPQIDFYQGNLGETGESKQIIESLRSENNELKQGLRYVLKAVSILLIDCSSGMRLWLQKDKERR